MASTNGDAVDIVENEGLGYAVQHYCDGDNFEDPVTRNLWNAAAASLNALTAYLTKQTGREVQ